MPWLIVSNFGLHILLHLFHWTRCIFSLLLELKCYIFLLLVSYFPLHLPQTLFPRRFCNTVCEYPGNCVLSLLLLTLFVVEVFLLRFFRPTVRCRDPRWPIFPAFCTGVRLRMEPNKVKIKLKLKCMWGYALIYGFLLITSRACSLSSCSYSPPTRWCKLWATSVAATVEKKKKADLVYSRYFQLLGVTPWHLLVLPCQCGQHKRLQRLYSTDVGHDEFQKRKFEVIRKQRSPYSPRTRALRTTRELWTLYEKVIFVF